MAPCAPIPAWTPTGSTAATPAAELFQADGYQTVAFITNGNVSESFGLNQGFEGYHRLPEKERSVEFHQRASEMIRWVVGWFEKKRDSERPLFFHWRMAGATSDPVFWRRRAKSRIRCG